MKSDVKIGLCIPSSLPKSLPQDQWQLLIFSGGASRRRSTFVRHKNAKIWREKKTDFLAPFLLMGVVSWVLPLLRTTFSKFHIKLPNMDIDILLLLSTFTQLISLMLTIFHVAYPAKGGWGGGRFPWQKKIGGLEKVKTIKSKQENIRRQNSRGFVTFSKLHNIWT